MNPTITNREGLQTELSDLLSEARYLAQVARATTKADLLDRKAQDVFYAHLQAAEDAGVTEEELDAISSEDVRLTVGELVGNVLKRSVVVQVVIQFYDFLTAEPDYGGICPF